MNTTNNDQLQAEQTQACNEGQGQSGTNFLSNVSALLKPLTKVLSVNRAGFYTLVPAFILCFIAPFMHRAGFGGTQYFNNTAFIIPIVGVIVSLLLSVCKYTARYSGLAMFITSFLSLLAFVAVAYMHLTSVFFDGIASTLGGILKQMGAHFSYCLIAYVVSMILSIVAVFLPEPMTKSVEA